MDLTNMISASEIYDIVTNFDISLTRGGNPHSFANNAGGLNSLRLPLFMNERQLEWSKSAPGVSDVKRVVEAWRVLPGQGFDPGGVRSGPTPGTDGAGNVSSVARAMADLDHPHIVQ